MFCFDSSAFINPYRRYYPFDVFPTFWTAIESRISAGSIVACDEVKREINRKDDDLAKWVKSQAGLFVPMDDDQQRHMIEIVGRFPAWVNAGSTKNSADPFVVALGRSRGLTVVHDEGRGSASDPKIPFVCGQYKVRELNVVQFIREIGLKF
ncbi:MAG: DUF4411 family protein [Kofleriaceae bacterium]|nr:DUF4411 family protein [Kofleriaceae bacterium]